MLNEPLVLLPGVLSNQIVWSYQIAHLSDLVHCQVIPLLEASTVDDLLEILINRIKGNFFLAGHSMGGWLALELARTIPERVLKLCLLNTTSREDLPEKRQSRLNIIAGVEQGQFQKIAGNLADHYVYDNKIRNQVLSMFLRVGEQALLNQERALLDRRSINTNLSQLTMPTMVIHAKRDAVFSLAEHQELATKIPKAKLAIIEEAGHMSSMEAPQAVTALMRFWLEYF